MTLVGTCVLLTRTARPLCVEFAGATYHVMARGNHGQSLCLDDRDRETWVAMLAMKNKMDLSLSIALGSSLQIALFVAPVLVFISLLLGHPLTLEFNGFEMISLTAAAAAGIVLGPSRFLRLHGYAQVRRQHRNDSLRILCHLERDLLEC